MPVCAHCKNVKRVDEMTINRQTVRGHGSYCKPCHRDRQKAGMTYEKARNWFLRSKYGITLREYEAMLKAQDGKCACCKQVPDPIYVKRHPKSAVFHVDHDHATGRVRGLLCYGCNCAMGFIRDHPDRLRLLIDYLERTNA